MLSCHSTEISVSEDRKNPVNSTEELRFDVISTFRPLRISGELHCCNSRGTSRSASHVAGNETANQRRVELPPLRSPRHERRQRRRLRSASAASQPPGSWRSTGRDCSDVTGRASKTSRGQENEDAVARTSRRRVPDAIRWRNHRGSANRCLRNFSDPVQHRNATTLQLQI